MNNTIKTIQINNTKYNILANESDQILYKSISQYSWTNSQTFNKDNPLCVTTISLPSGTYICKTSVQIYLPTNGDVEDSSSGKITTSSSNSGNIYMALSSSNESYEEYDENIFEKWDNTRTRSSKSICSTKIITIKEDNNNLTLYLNIFCSAKPENAYSYPKCVGGSIKAIKLK